MPALFFWLLIAHAVCDFPLQGDFLAHGKNHRDPIPGVPWFICLLAHALIHAGGVALVTGSVAAGLAEFAVHALIDFGKCQGWYGFGHDQALHVFTKPLWLLL